MAGPSVLTIPIRPTVDIEGDMGGAPSSFEYGAGERPLDIEGDMGGESSIDYGLETSPLEGVILDKRTAKERVEKYAQAMPITPEEMEDMVSSVAQGYDSKVRSDLLIKKEKFSRISRQSRFLKVIGDEEAAFKILQEDLNTKDVNSFLEKDYAKNFLLTPFQTGDSEDGLDESRAKVLKEIESIKNFDTATNLIATREIALRLQQDMAAKVKQMGYIPFGIDIAMSMVPFASSAIQGKVKNIQGLEDLGLGQNLDKEYTKIWSLPPEEAAKILKERVEEISKDSPVAALDYIHKFIEGGTANRVIDNLFSIVDASLFFPTVKGIKQGAAFSGAVAKQTLGMITSPGATLGTASAAAGNLAQAARYDAMQKLFSQVGQDIPSRGSFFPYMENLATIINPQQLFTGGAHGLSSNGTTRIMTQIEANAAKIVDYFLNAPVTQRLEGNVLDVAVKEARDLASLQYPGISNHVLTVVPRYSTLGDNFFADIILGDRHAQAFATADQADIMAKYFLFLKDYEVAKVGSGYFIKLSKPLDETTDGVMDALRYHVETNDPTPQSLANAYLRHVKSNDYTLSDRTNTDLKKAVYSTNSAVALIRHIVEPIKLNKKSREAFLSFIDAQKLYVDPIKRTTGRFSADANEFEQEWFSMFKRSPSEKEQAAYFSYRQLNDADYMIRNLSFYRDKIRTGLEMHQFNIGGVKWKGGAIPTIEGKVVSEMPWHHTQGPGGRSFGILVVGDQPRRLSSHNSFRETEELIKQGYRIVNITKYGEDALRAYPVVGSKLPKGKIDYVLVPPNANLRSSALPLQQTPFREGYHIMLDDNTYMVKQANVQQEAGRTIYYGDRNIIQARTAKQAKEFAEAFEYLRPIVKEVIDGVRPGQDLAQALIARKIPFTAQDVITQFKTHLDVDTPILWSKKNQDLENAHKISNGYQNFTRHSDDPYNPLRGMNFAFGDEKGEPISSVRQIGSHGGVPVWNIEPGKYLDGFNVIQRSSEKLVKDVALRDMKINAANRFIEEFGDLLEGTKQEMRRNPMAVLENPLKFQSGVDDAKVAAAKQLQRSVLEFLQVRGDAEKHFEFLQQKVSDMVFESFGEKGVNVLGNIERHIPTNPIKFLRAMTTNIKFGFFNTAQLFVQAQGVATIAGLEGVTRAAQGSAIFTLMRYGNGNMNPRLLDTMGDLAVKLGFKDREHFKEMYREAHFSGFDKVGNTYTGMENYLSPHFIDTPLDKGVNYGMAFFKLGEEIPKKTAYAVAYKRWRDENPTAKFSVLAKEEVLKRADMLTNYMSSASNAAWNKGFLSVTSQFMSYQARLMELVWSNKISHGQRARLVAVHSALYGVPIGVAGPFLGGVWPMHETIKQVAIENGINLEPNVIMKGLNDGIPSLITEFITGSEQNVSERFGSGGNSLFRDIVLNWKGTGKKDIMETLAGPAGNTMYNVVKSSQPLFYSFYRTVLGKEAWPLQRDDLISFTKEVSSVNNGIKAAYAIGLGQYLTKQHNPIVHDAKFIEGLMTGLLGTVPDRVDKYYNIAQASKEMKVAKDFAKKNATLQYVKAMEQFKAGREDRAAEHLKKAQFYMLPLNPTEQSATFKDAMKSNLKGVEEMELKYGMKNDAYWNTFFKKEERIKN